MSADPTIRLRRFSLKLATPMRTAGGRIDRRRGWVIEFVDRGTVGLGESTPLSGWTEDYESCQAALTAAKVALEDDGWAAALAAVEDTPAARHGVTAAYLDHEASRVGRPLYRHLGATEPVRTLDVNATLSSGRVAPTVAAAERAVADGFRTVKCKVGADDPDRDRTRLRAVRAAVGTDVALRADANGAWDRETAVRTLESVADIELEYVEQPVPGRELGSLAAVRERSAVPVAADEALATVGAERVIDDDAADVLVCKPMVLGGIDRTMAVIRRARHRGLDVTVTTTVDAAIARATAVHTAAAGAPARTHGVATGGRLAGDLTTGPSVSNGRIRVPQTVGIGIDVGALDNNALEDPNADA